MTDTLSHLRVELRRDGKSWRLLEPLSYMDAEEGLIAVSEDFVTDFASTKPVRNIALIALCITLLFMVLPWEWLSDAARFVGAAALVLYAVVAGYGHPAAAVHDYLYCTGQMSRAKSDAVFLRALRKTGVALWRAWLMWAGVRVGGHWRYNAQRKRKPPCP